MCFLDFPMFVLFVHCFSDVFPVFASTSLEKNKKIQALIKSYVFLTQKFGCMPGTEIWFN